MVGETVIEGRKFPAGSREHTSCGAAGEAGPRGHSG